MAPTPNKEAAKGACADINEAMPFLKPSDTEKLELLNIPYDRKMVWVPDKDKGYVQGTIQEDDGETYKIKADGKDKIHEVKKDDLCLKNPPKFEQADDMANMSMLSEATVLYNLASRYELFRIYTYSGLFCVCVNPYKWLQIYGDVVVGHYRGKKRTECPPHLYSIADNAYQDMLRDRECQSILITGESGAGKTENTKKVIGYMAAVAGGGNQKEGEAGLEDQIVQTNPILEAWGNAKTIRNNNSSRFGKFIRVHFGNTGKLSGGDIEVYLLEKSRVVFQLSDERNYHIFFQIMYSKQQEVLDMCLVTDNPKDYFWAGQQGVIVVDRMDDTFEYNCTTEAFKILGFSDDERDSSYKITCGVMLMGDMKYAQKPRDEQAEVDTPEIADKFSHLFGLKSNEVCQAFCRPRVKVGTEMVTKGQNVDQCNNATGAIAKAVFDKLFQWLVKMCNRTLDTDLPRSYFCGVLDIAGFEIFDFNTFEQLCINFTNEKLQQFFNHHMFVLEQEEYKKEGIEWVTMNFGMDLQACIDLLEKGNGVFSTLEEQSIVPKATDQTFIAKLYETHEKKNPAFIKPKPGKANKGKAHFICRHYAGEVGYNLDNWLEKNKDPLNSSVVELLQKSALELVRTHLFPVPKEGDDEPTGGKKKKKKKGGSMQTVSQMYREQLKGLMTTLKSTHPSFVRCIVPNETKTPGAVENNLILHQLRCNGVLEGIRICRKGFPNRMLYPEFKQRYMILAAAELKNVVDSKAAAEIILKKIELSDALYKIGHTKVFFKAGILADLEDYRDEALGVIFTKLQARARGKLMRIEFEKMLKKFQATKIIQTNIRAFLSFKDWEWWHCFTAIKPMLNVGKQEEEMKAKDAEMTASQQQYEEACNKIKELEATNAKLGAQKMDLARKLGTAQELIEEQKETIAEMITKNNALEEKCKDLSESLAHEEAENAKLTTENYHLTEDLAEANKKIENLEATKKDLQTKVAALTADVEARDATINGLETDKKGLQQNLAATKDDLASSQEKATHLGKVKGKLEAALAECEDNLESEKKALAETRKNKKNLETDLKAANESIWLLETAKAEFENKLKKKDADVTNINEILGDVEAANISVQRKLKEAVAKCEVLEGELFCEQSARARVERNRNDVVRDTEATVSTLTSNLEKAGQAIKKQSELLHSREVEFGNLRTDFEKAMKKAEHDLLNMKKEHTDIAGELNLKIESLSLTKQKNDKEKTQLQLENADLASKYDALGKDKIKIESNLRSTQQDLNQAQVTAEAAATTVNELTAAKQKAANDAKEAGAQCDAAETKVSQLSREVGNLGELINTMKAQADKEQLAKGQLSQALQNAENDIDSLKQAIEEAHNGKSKVQRQLTEEITETANWRSKYEALRLKAGPA
jgi:myosin heavy subunit